MRGRWEGTLIREHEKRSHPFIVKIHQTLTKIQVNTFSDNGKNKSTSIIANITSDEMEKKFTLCYLWQASAGPIHEQNIPAGNFNGYSMLELNETEKPKELSGHYFTNRAPQTKGEIELKRVDQKRKGKY